MKDNRTIFRLGGIATIFALAGILLDVIIGNITGGDLTALPTTAIGRFKQLNENCWLGLYNLDLLNLLVQLLMIPSFFALYLAHLMVKKEMALLSLIIFLVGTTIFVANNTALPMLDLSQKFASETDMQQKNLLAAAGEAMLARGAHGSPGVFISFFLPNLAIFLMSMVMLKGKVFGRINAWLGIIGGFLMMIYVVLVNFVPGIDKMATAVAMPGGLLLMVWMIIFTIRLFKFNKK